MFLHLNVSTKMSNPSLPDDDPLQVIYKFNKRLLDAYDRIHITGRGPVEAIIYGAFRIEEEENQNQMPMNAGFRKPEPPPPTTIQLYDSQITPPKKQRAKRGSKINTKTKTISCKFPIYADDDFEKAKIEAGCNSSNEFLLKLIMNYLGYVWVEPQEGSFQKRC